MVCAREYSFNDAENRKTFKRALARHLLHILPVGRITFFFCARSPKKLYGKQFSKLFKEFFPKT
jgi:hypothetical protein